MDKTQPFEVPSGRVARGRVTAPPSKSHAIRALVCAALADGTSTLHGLSGCDAEDVVHAVGALRTLGFAIDGDRVTGGGGKVPNPDATIYLGGSATAFRFLTAVAALGPGPTRLTCDATLAKRPMGSIVKAVQSLRIRVQNPDGEKPMLVVSGGPPLHRHHVDIDTSGSSQTLSALLLISPVVARPPILTSRLPMASADYVRLTESVMERFGAQLAVDINATRYIASNDPDALGYRAAELSIVGDWSSAAFPMAAAAVSGIAEVHGLEWDSPQADRRIVEILREFGATVLRTASGVRVVAGDRHSVDVDLRDAPDLAPLVGALGCVASGTTRVRGAAHLRLKESDRIATVVAAARALGCEAHELPDGFTITGPARHGGTIETKHDHRIAMAFAVAGLAVPGVVIDDPACVAKSYPGFWEDLLRLIE